MPPKLSCLVLFTSRILIAISLVHVFPSPSVCSNTKLLLPLYFLFTCSNTHDMSCLSIGSLSILVFHVLSLRAHSNIYPYFVSLSDTLSTLCLSPQPQDGAAGFRGSLVAARDPGGASGLRHLLLQCDQPRRRQCDHPRGARWVPQLSGCCLSVCLVMIIKNALGSVSYQVFEERDHSCNFRLCALMVAGR